MLSLILLVNYHCLFCRSQNLFSVDFLICNNRKLPTSHCKNKKTELRKSKLAIPNLCMSKKYGQIDKFFTLRTTVRNSLQHLSVDFVQTLPKFRLVVDSILVLDAHVVAVTYRLQDQFSAAILVQKTGV